MPEPPDAEPGPTTRRATWYQALARLATAVRDADQHEIERAVAQLGDSRRWLAPLSYVAGGFGLLFDGVKLLFLNWRLLLIQILPAMWIWVAFMDLKLHVFKGKSFHVMTGWPVIASVLAITVVTAACFYLNAVFAFAISNPGAPQIRPAFALARRHLKVVLGVGCVVGLALGVSAIIVPRWGSPWFGLSMGIVVGVMMMTYVSVPARIIGVKPAGTPRDKMAAAAIGGTMSAIVSAPAYLIGRIGILLLGSKALFPLAIAMLVVGFALLAGATGAVKAIKMSAKLAAGQVPAAAKSA